MHKENLAMKTLLTPSLEYSSDDDGNIAIYQLSNTVWLTPKQQQELLSLLETNLDLNISKCLEGLK